MRRLLLQKWDTPVTSEVPAEVPGVPVRTTRRDWLVLFLATATATGLRWELRAGRVAPMFPIHHTPRPPAAKRLPARASSTLGKGP
ncbi:hypothetical protein PG997_002176 [Apiospora hydei]|uniref:Uncharacterized protein n=1 Tax=Apiospora hydei TaxID=1337664 RepID=A0ABR1X8Q8_9PEZI